MTDLFSRHRALLERAVTALHERSYWTPYPEVPSIKNYGETAKADGEAAFAALKGQLFQLTGHPESSRRGAEVSPFGPELGITYPACEPATLIAAAKNAAPALAAAWHWDWLSGPRPARRALTSGWPARPGGSARRAGAAGAAETAPARPGARPGRHRVG